VNKYWVEAKLAVKDRTKVIGYGVWHIDEKGARTCVHLYSASRKHGADCALYLANLARDDLNNGDLV